MSLRSVCLVGLVLPLMACSGSSESGSTTSSSTGGTTATTAGTSTSGSTSSNGASGSSSSTGGTTGTSAGTGSGSTGGSSGSSGSQPIVAPPDQWTWVDFPDTKCASGTPTGLAVNPHAGATELVIYLEGGGACTTAASCWGSSPTARNVAGYDATTFASASQVRYPLLNRSISGNPFAAMNMVYVPYCTGDMHAGTAEKDLPAGDGGVIPTYFWGANDMDAYLARLVATFPGTTRVWLFGTSAGGFGTFLNYDRVARAFRTRVNTIDDSGPPILAKNATDNMNLFNTWSIVPPAHCTGCTTFRSIYDFDRTLQPASQYAFLSYAQDSTIAPDFGYSLTEYATVISDFSNSIASDPHAATFVVTNKVSHVVESDLTLEPQYMPWLQAMVANDGGWSDVTYAHP